MLFIYFLLYIWRFFKSLFGFSFTKYEKKKLLKELNEKLEEAKTYEEYYQISIRIDELNGVNEWKNRKESSYYDYNGIERKLNILTSLLDSEEKVHDLKAYLRSSLIRNIGGIGNFELYSRSKIGTKKLIEDYVDGVVKSLEYICENEFEDFPPEEKFEFFYETRQAFGRSALCLSGGATLGMYHLGVVKVLFEHQLLPRVISGSSVGSIIASVLATKLDSELPSLFQQNGINFNAFDSKGSARRKIKRLLTEGVLMDIRKLEQCIRDNIGDITFKESYDRTKRILNITVASTTPHEMPRLLNYLTSPNVLIWSAAAASCALAFLYKPVELMVKDENGEIKPYSTSGLLWSDGSVESDLPMNRLSELFNVNHFLVSQVNPHVIPFLTMTENNRLGIVGKLIVDEFRMRLKQLSGYFLRGNRFLRQLAVVINQKYSGDITIYPDITLDDYRKLLSNPVPEWMSECQIKSERKTWRYLSYIKHHCAIELSLDRCMRKMAKQVQNTDRKKVLSVYKKVHK